MDVAGLMLSYTATTLSWCDASHLNAARRRAVDAPSARRVGQCAALDRRRRLGGVREQRGPESTR